MELSNCRAKYFPAHKKFIHYKNQKLAKLHRSVVVAHHSQVVRNACNGTL
jgi:hypothetical protein